jgi:flagellar L-ring protein precursor FlgH
MNGNARRVGDLITVIIDESASTSLGAQTDDSRDSSTGFGVTAMLGLEASITKANPNMGGGINIGGSSSSSHSGQGTTTRNGTLSATLTCQVQEVLPNGNLRIRGTKEVRVNRETQYLTLEGVVRPRDILLDNTVRSNVIADARVEYTGAGVIASQQGQGWGTAVLNSVWPF